MSTPHPQPVVELAGTRRVLESAHKLVGATWGEEGTTRAQHAWIADPDLIRTLDVGQACYIHRGGATFVQVARPKPSPLSLPAAQVRPPTVIIPPPAPPRMTSHRPRGRVEGAWMTCSGRGAAHERQPVHRARAAHRPGRER